MSGKNEIHVPLVDGRQDNRSASLANPDYIVKDDEKVTCFALKSSVCKRKEGK